MLLYNIVERKLDCIGTRAAFTFRVGQGNKPVLVPLKHECNKFTQEMQRNGSAGIQRNRRMFGQVPVLPTGCTIRRC